MNKTDEAFAAVIAKLTALADAQGAQAVALGGRALQYSVAGSMLWPVLMLLVAGGLALAAKRVISVFCEVEAGKREAAVDAEAYLVGGCFIGAAAAILGAIGIGGFFIETASPLNWAILSDWRIGLAAKALKML